MHPTEPRVSQSGSPWQWLVPDCVPCHFHFSPKNILHPKHKCTHCLSSASGLANTSPQFPLPLRRRCCFLYPGIGQCSQRAPAPQHQSIPLKNDKINDSYSHPLGSSRGLIPPRGCGKHRFHESPPPPLGLRLQPQQGSFLSTAHIHPGQRVWGRVL